MGTTIVQGMYLIPGVSDGQGTAVSSALERAALPLPKPTLPPNLTLHLPRSLYSIMIINSRGGVVPNPDHRS